MHSETLCGTLAHVVCRYHKVFSLTIGVVSCHPEASVPVVQWERSTDADLVARLSVQILSVSLEENWEGPDQNFLTEQPEELELGSMWLLVLSYTQMEMELWEDQMSPRI